MTSRIKLESIQGLTNSSTITANAAALVLKTSNNEKLRIDDTIQITGNTFITGTLRAGSFTLPGDQTIDKLTANTVHVAKKLTANVSGTNILTTQGPITTPKITANTVNATAANFTTLQADVIDFDGDVTVDTVTANSVNATTANFTVLQADSIDFDGDMTVDKVTANTIHSLVKITANNIGTTILTTQGPITAPKVTANSFGKIVTSNIITTPAVIANTFQSHTSKIADGNAVNGSVNIAEASNDAGIVMSIFGNNTNYTRISGQKSRNASVGGHTIIQDGDGILEIGENVSEIKIGDIFDFYDFETLF